MVKRDESKVDELKRWQAETQAELDALLPSILDRAFKGEMQMPIRQYEGETFVAFVDICGFTEMMADGDRALEALDGFYSAGQRILREQQLPEQQRVEGFFISDSGVLFVRGLRNDAHGDSLERLLRVVRDVNAAMIAQGVMLATSVAYGNFACDDRLEFSGINKSAIRGTAYVAAVLDNMKRRPAILPGQCRIVKHGLPTQVTRRHDDGLFDLVRQREGDRDCLYYYWMLRSAAEVPEFERDFKNATDARYREQLRVLRRVVAQTPNG